jgi:hypothetical protein
LTTPLLIGSGIFIATVVIQALAIMALLDFLRRRMRLNKFHENLVVATGALSGGMLIVFVGHLLQVGLWALLFVGLGEFESYASAFYHSMVNFTSLGYGDLVMSEVGLAVVTSLIQRRGDGTSEFRKVPPP